MSCVKSLEEIKRDLRLLEGFWVVAYGSWARGEATARSDIDIAVITKSNNREENLEVARCLLGKAPPCYDVKVFELLPLHLKAEVLSRYVVVFGNPLEISEYFYYYRKLWKDMERRYRENQYSSYKELIKAIERRKKLLKHMEKPHSTQSKMPE